MTSATIQTIFLLYSALSCAAGFLIAALFWKRNDLSAKLWIYGCFFTSIATAVTVFRSDIPLAISYSLMVSFELMSILLIGESLKRLSGIYAEKKFDWLILAIPIGLFLVIELGRYSGDGLITPTITATATFTFGVANLFCLYHAISVGKDFKNPFFLKFLAVIFGLASTLYFLRIANIFTGYSGFVFDLKTYNIVIWFALSLLNSIRNLTYIVLRLHLGFSEHNRLNNMNLDLQNTLEERNAMILSIQRLNKSASINALASTISHEINQPLAASKLNTQFIEMKLISDPNNISLFKELIKNILGDINRASMIVKNLARITSNKNSKVELFKVSETINDVIEISRGKLQNSKITVAIHCELNHSINVNLSEWQQVLINIINNSIDALDSIIKTNKRILITVSEVDESIQITIQDNGPGITVGQEANIFEMMVSNKDSGSGIGLWLSKNIVNRFGGDITAHNVDTCGAMFIIRLPKT